MTTVGFQFGRFAHVPDLASALTLAQCLGSVGDVEPSPIGDGWWSLAFRAGGVPVCRVYDQDRAALERARLDIVQREKVAACGTTAEIPVAPTSGR